MNAAPQGAVFVWDIGLTVKAVGPYWSFLYVREDDGMLSYSANLTPN